MPLTEFPNGVSSFGAPVLPGAPALPIAPGANVFYVDSTNTAARNAAGAGTVERPFASIDFAVGRCTANNGDFIFVQPGHLENVIAAAGLDLDVAGITIVFLGNGQDRGRIRFGTVVGADMDVDAADITMVNARFQANLDALTGPIDVNAARFRLFGATWEDGTAINTTDCVVADANADNMVIDGFEFVDGNAAGTQKQSFIQVAAATGVIIRDVKCTGDFGTGIIENGTAWIDALVEGCVLDNANAGPVVAILLQATSTGWMRDCSLRVASGTTYLTANNDMQFDRVYGTGTDATATEEVGTQVAGSLESKIDVIDGFHDVPGADVATNAQMRDVVGNKTDAAAAGAVSATESLMAYVKQAVTQLGADADTNAIGTVLTGGAGVAAWPAALEPANAVNFAEAIRWIANAVRVGTGQAMPANQSLYGALAGSDGVLTYPAAAAPANAISLAAVQRELFDQADKGVSSATAVITNNLTLFTIAGGPIEVLSLVSECVTGNDATASTLQYRSNPTTGAAATFSAASASLANALAGASVVLQGTTLATAPLVNVSGPGIAQQVTNAIYVPAGTIQAVVGVGSTTGTWVHRLRYRPLARGVTVS